MAGVGNAGRNIPENQPVPANIKMDFLETFRQLDPQCKAYYLSLALALECDEIDFISALEIITYLGLMLYGHKNLVRAISEEE